jgi:hypothetical protein
MQIPTYKKKWFEEAGFPADVINATDQAIAIFDEDAENVGAPRKAKEEAPMPVDEKDKEEEKEVGIEKASQPDLSNLRNEIAEAVVGVVTGLQENITKEIGDVLARLEAIEKSVKQLEETDTEKLSRQREEVPPASLSAIIGERLMKSASKGNMRKDDPLANRAPRETQPEPGPNNGGTGIPVLDAQIAGNKKNGRGGY